MKMKSVDIGVGATLCVFSSVVYIYAERYKGAGLSNYGPNFFPQILAVLMFISSIVMIVQAVRGKSITVTDRIDRTGFIRAALALGISILYLLLMQVLGFFLSTLIFLYVLMSFIGHRGRLVRALSCLAVTAIIYSIFFFFLKIPLPQGLLALIF